MAVDGWPGSHALHGTVHAPLSSPGFVMRKRRTRCAVQLWRLTGCWPCRAKPVQESIIWGELNVMLMFRMINSLIDRSYVYCTARFMVMGAKFVTTGHWAPSWSDKAIQERSLWFISGYLKDTGGGKCPNEYPVVTGKLRFLNLHFSWFYAPYFDHQHENFS